MSQDICVKKKNMINILGYYLFTANILMWSESKIVHQSPDI